MRIKALILVALAFPVPTLASTQLETMSSDIVGLLESSLTRTPATIESSATSELKNTDPNMGISARPTNSERSGTLLEETAFSSHRD